MSKTKQWLLFYFGTAFQCDSLILEALDLAIPPSSRDIWQRLSNDCSVQNLMNHFHFRSIPGWAIDKSQTDSESVVISPIGSSRHGLFLSGQLELSWPSGSSKYLYEHHLKDPNYFSWSLFDKKDNLHALNIIHQSPSNRSVLVAHFNKEKLLNLKTLRDQLLFANSKLYELVKLD